MKYIYLSLISLCAIICTPVLAGEKTKEQEVNKEAIKAFFYAAKELVKGSPYALKKYTDQEMKLKEQKKRNQDILIQYGTPDFVDFGTRFLESSDSFLLRVYKNGRLEMIHTKPSVHTMTKGEPKQLYRSNSVNLVQRPSTNPFINMVEKKMMLNYVTKPTEPLFPAKFRPRLVISPEEQPANFHFYDIDKAFNAKLIKWLDVVEKQALASIEKPVEEKSKK